MLTREEKSEIIENVAVNIKKSDAIFLTNLVGLTANDSVDLRKKVRAANGHICVTKNTFFKRASTGTYAEKLCSNLTGTNALAFSFSDPAAVAKVLNDFKKQNELVAIKGGYLGEKEISSKEIEFLANLPSRDQMLGTLLATFNAPVSAFARLLFAIKEQKEAEGVAAV